jgi:hypothetical protein
LAAEKPLPRFRLDDAVEPAGGYRNTGQSSSSESFSADSSLPRHVSENGSDLGYRPDGKRLVCFPIESSVSADEFPFSNNINHLHEQNDGNIDAPCTRLARPGSFARPEIAAASAAAIAGGLWLKQKLMG